MSISPMLAKSSGNISLVDLGDGYVFEPKLDGIRAIVYASNGRYQITNRVGTDITYRYPDLILPPRFTGTLDGEIVARTGNFEDIARRDAQQTFNEDVADEIPVLFIPFDILQHGEKPTMDLRYLTRRGILESLDDIAISKSTNDAAYFDVYTAEGGEGVVAKHVDSIYVPGSRSPYWIKFKKTHRITAVATGYERGRGRREDIGSISVSLYYGTELVEVAKVGTGFTDSELSDLKHRLDSAGTVLVELEAANKTRRGRLRFPVYKGIRSDIDYSAASADQLDGIPST